MNEEEIEKRISDFPPMVIRGWGLNPNIRVFELIYDGPLTGRMTIRFKY